jgi:hypothetical protein
MPDAQLFTCPGTLGTQLIAPVPQNTPPLDGIQVVVAAALGGTNDPLAKA